MIYAFGGCQYPTDNFLIERYDIERNYWITLHVLLEYEFDFQKHKVMFNMAKGYRGVGYDNIHIVNVQRVEDD